MTAKQKRDKELNSAFKIYNGSAMSFHPKKPVDKSIGQICKNGSHLLKGTTVEQAMRDSKCQY